jgi:excisionase family DNA binding protein
MVVRNKRAPKQISYLKTVSQVKNGDVLDVAEAAALLKVSKETIHKRVRDNAIPHARLGRKLLFHRQNLIHWVANGGDRATEATPEEQLMLDQLIGMLQSGQTRLVAKHG